jgi:hypothetical protein
MTVSCTKLSAQIETAPLRTGSDVCMVWVGNELMPYDTSMVVLLNSEGTAIYQRQRNSRISRNAASHAIKDLLNENIQLRDQSAEYQFAATTATALADRKIEELGTCKSALQECEEDGPGFLLYLATFLGGGLTALLLVK